MNQQPLYSIEPCDKKGIEEILEGLNTYNLKQVPPMAPAWTPVELIARDKNKETIGGILGGIGYWKGFEIKYLWVKEKHRMRGIGTSILKHAEEMATKYGAEIAMLDTFDFQARDFYVKNGYKEIGTINDFPPGHKRIYFSKVLKRTPH